VKYIRSTLRYLRPDHVENTLPKFFLSTLKEELANSLVFFIFLEKRSFFPSCNIYFAIDAQRPYRGIRSLLDLVEVPAQGRRALRHHSGDDTFQSSLNLYNRDLLWLASVLSFS
jgi:hypothetical protein